MAAGSDIRVTTHTLDEHAMEALLAKHHVGSMAITFHDRVTIALVNYVYANRAIYARLEEGPDLATIQHHHWVAFQVSEIHGIYDWRTVTVHGSIQVLTDGPSDGAAAEFRQAVDLIRSVVPAVFTQRDPMPQRVYTIRLFVDELTGREARSNTPVRIP